MSEISPRARKLVEAYRNAVGAVHMGSGDDLPYTNARNALFDYIANLEASKSDERGQSEPVAWIETISYKGRLIGKGLVFHKPAPRPDVILEPLYAKPPAEAAERLRAALEEIKRCDTYQQGGGMMEDRHGRFHEIASAALTPKESPPYGGEGAAGMNTVERVIPKPGDLIVWKPAPGSKAREHVWRVLGCRYGAMGVEDIIEVENVSHKSGWTDEWMTHQLMFIPACLLWECEIRKPTP